jgi:hypothetical protein
MLPNDPNNWTINYYYNIRWKGHFETDWHNLYLISDGYPTQHYESAYTVLSYECKYSSTDGLDFEAGSIRTTLPVGAQVDFQIQAMIGYIHRDNSYWSPYVLEGETSSWSNTQTLTITETAPTAAPTTSPPSAASQDASLIPIQSGQMPMLFSWNEAEIVIVSLLGVIAVLLVFVVVYLRKRSLK